jgi:hypothetical protein
VGPIDLLFFVNKAPSLLIGKLSRVSEHVKNLERIGRKERQPMRVCFSQRWGKDEGPDEIGSPHGFEVLQLCSGVRLLMMLLSRRIRFRQNPRSVVAKMVS